MQVFCSARFLPACRLGAPWLFCLSVAVVGLLGRSPRAYGDSLSAQLPVDVDGDGIANDADRFVLDWYVEETGTSLWEVLSHGVASGDVIDLSAYFGSRAASPTTGRAAVAQQQGGGAQAVLSTEAVLRRWPVKFENGEPVEPDGPSQHARVTPGSRFFVFSSQSTGVDTQVEVSGSKYQVYRVQRKGNGGFEQKIASVVEGSVPPEPADDDCLHSSISDDGSVVVFDTLAVLVDNDDSNGKKDIYARDFGASETQIVSQSSTSSESANNTSESPAISGDGAFFAFTSKATDIDSSFSPSGGFTHVYRFERGVGGSGEHVSTNEDGDPVDGAATADPGLNAVGKAINEDGSLVVYQGEDSGGSVVQCWLRDLDLTGNKPIVLSATSDTTFGNDDSRNPTLATRFPMAAFSSKATNLDFNDGATEDIFAAYDFADGGQLTGYAQDTDNLTLDLGANGASTRAMLTTDGTFATFTSEATNLVSGDTDSNGVRDVFLASVPGLNPAEIDEIERIKSVDDEEGDALSQTSDVADGGLTVVFESDAENLLGEGVDTNEERDIFEVSEPGAERDFRRGDANDDGIVDQSDAIFILSYLYLGTVYPDCLDAADADDSGALDTTDPVYLLVYLSQGGDPPPSPGPTNCGPDPTTGDSFDCELSICE